MHWLISQGRRRFLFFLTTLFITTAPNFAQMVYTVLSAEEADVVVFVTENEADCDLKVFFVEEQSQLGHPGVWAGTFEPDKAEKKVFFTFEESESQLKIFVVDEESKAGWVNKAKMNLFEVPEKKS